MRSAGTRLKFVCRFAYGDALPSENGSVRDIPVFGSNGIYATTSNANTRTPAIIVGRKGSYGKVNWSALPCFASDTTFFVDNAQTPHNLRWLFWVLQTLGLDVGSNEAAVPGLNRETVYEKRILVPHKEQQHRIANYLDTETAQIDTLVAEKEKMLALLEEKRGAFISRAVTSGLNPEVSFKPSSIPWLRKIPEHWEERKLKYVAHLKSGNFITSQSIAESGDYPVFGGNGIRGYTSSFTHVGDHVLIGRQGALCGNIHYASGKFWASEHAVVARILGEEEVHWLGEILRVMNLNQYSESAAQPGISVEVIGNLKIPVPPISEQRAIVAHLSTKKKETAGMEQALHKSISLLKERRGALISAAVTGQIELEA